MAPVKASRRGHAIRLVLTATLLYASAPPLLHVTASDTNPFYFNALITMMQVAIPGIFLLCARTTYVNGRLGESQRRRLTRPTTHCVYLRRVREAGAGGDKAVILRRLQAGDALSVFKLPIVWALISSLHYGFLTWAATILETAIATTIFELWPVFLVYTLARHNDSDRRFRGAPSRIGQASGVMSKERMVLIALAGIGLAGMLGSQAGGQIRSAADLVSFEAVAGMALALIASMLAALSVVSTLAYGKTLYYALVDAPATVSGEYSTPSPTPIELRGDPDRRLLVWLTMLGYVMARIVALPVNILIGMFAPQVDGSLTPEAVLGALLIGAAASVAGITLRVGNIRTEDAAVNSLLCFGPVVSLLALMALGITLPRFDLFVVGAILILAVNVRIQLRPNVDIGTR